MPLRLISPDGTQSYDLRDGAPMIVGRAPTCDLAIFDPTISRQHAELRCVESTLRVRDLGSSNGTFLNGTKIDSATASADDLVAFGKVAFRLQRFEHSAPVPAPAISLDPPAGATIVRQISMREPRASLDGLGVPTTLPGGVKRALITPGSLASIGKSQQKLAILLEV
jgi:pSer/pThr/pTyr-binding forkhead associated (FHA) protein